MSNLDTVERVSLFAFEHTALLPSLPFHHRDPFDRLLVAQSMVERMPLVSVDTTFDTYGIERLW